MLLNPRWLLLVCSCFRGINVQDELKSAATNRARIANAAAAALA